MSKQESYDIVIVGGGISGLSFAHYVARSGKKVLVLEAGEKHGGCINTFHLQKEKFWLEMGAHTCYNSYSGLIDIALENNLKTHITGREKLSLKLYDKSLQGIFSRINKLELLCSLPRMFSLKKQGTDVQTFYSKALGAKNYKQLFSRLFSAVIVQNADNYAADLFLKRRSTRRKEFPKSFTFSNGIQELLDSIITQKNITLQLNSRVIGLLSDTDGYTLETAQKEKIFAEKVALAISPPKVAELLSKVAPELSDLLADIPVQNIHTRAVKLQKNGLQMERLAFIIPLEGACYSVVTRDVVNHPELRAFAFHFADGKMDEKEQVQLMGRILNVDAAKLTNTIECRHTLPLLKAGHAGQVKKIDAFLEKTGLYLTGNYFDGLSLEDCVSRSWKEYNRMLIADRMM